MNFVFLSPYFPVQYKHFAIALKEAGATVLGLGDNTFDSLDHDLKSALTEYYKVEDLHNYDQLLRALGYFTHKYGKIDRIESLNEYWLNTEARLRQDFNISGIKNDGIDKIRKKSRMKEIFRKARIKVAEGKIIQDFDQARLFTECVGFPVVAKPDEGVGAQNTFKIENKNDLHNFFSLKPDQDYFFEQFVNGTIYSFDGLTDQHGNIIFNTSHMYSQGIMETVNEDRHVWYTSLREIPKKLEVVGKKTVKAFEIKERFFHIEFFYTAQKEFIALEINMRPPGGYTTDMFNYASNIDIYKTWAQMVVNNRNEINYQRLFFCCYASRKNNMQYKFNHEDIMKKYHQNIVMKNPIDGVFRNALGDYGYIFRSPDKNKINEISSFIHETMGGS